MKGDYHKKRPTKRDDTQEIRQKEEEFISAEEFFKDSFGDMPKWAVCFAGLRHREGLTQKELGARIEVSRYNISKMEGGHRAIGKNIAKRLAEVFKTDYRLFL